VCLELVVRGLQYKLNQQVNARLMELRDNIPLPPLEQRPLLPAKITETKGNVLNMEAESEGKPASSSLLASKKNIKSQIDRWQRVKEQTSTSSNSSNLPSHTKKWAKDITETFIKSESASFSATSVLPPTIPTDIDLNIKTLPVQHFSNLKELICTLCQRRFPNMGLLEKHAELSELHQTNLKAYLASNTSCMVNNNTNTIEEIPSLQTHKKVKYKDRAEERRKLTENIMSSFALPEPKYLVSEDVAGSTADEQPASPSVPIETEDVEPVSDEEVYRMANANNSDKFQQQHALKMARLRYQSIETSSLAKNELAFKSGTGMKLLMKMGWKEGQGLGKDAAGMKEPILPEAMQKGKGLGAHK